MATPLQTPNYSDFIVDVHIAHQEIKKLDKDNPELANHLRMRLAKALQRVLDPGPKS